METNSAILNKGLWLAMEWGDDWMTPIKQRLAVQYPSLSDREVSHYDKVCREVMKKGHAFVIRRLSEVAKSSQTIENDSLRSEFELYVKNNNEWMNDENISKLYSQGCYYAWKEGLIGAIV